MVTEDYPVILFCIKCVAVWQGPAESRIFSQFDVNPATVIVDLTHFDLTKGVVCTGQKKTHTHNNKTTVDLRPKLGEWEGCVRPSRALGFLHRGFL